MGLLRKYLTIKKKKNLSRLATNRRNYNSSQPQICYQLKVSLKAAICITNIMSFQ